MRGIINIAHRGYTREHPDNTLEAFRAALELGADGVEFDVQETVDGEFVIYHDDDIGGKPIIERSLAALHVLRLRGKYRIPTLEETLGLLGRETVKMVELKQVRSVGRCLDVLRALSDVNRVVVVSFSPELIARVQKLAPGMLCAVIGGDKVAGSDSESTVNKYFTVRCAEVDDQVVARAHREGKMVFVWDCPEEAGVHRALQFDIDGIISDYPDIVKEAANR